MEKKIVNKISKYSTGVRVMYLVYSLKALFRSIFFLRKRIPVKASVPVYNQAPFFIVGAGRSGNTLLRAMLSTSDNVEIPPEFYAMKKLIIALLKNRGLEWKKLCQVAIDTFFNTSDIDTWNISKEEVIVQLDNYKTNEKGIDNLIYVFYNTYKSKINKNEIVMLGDKTPNNAFNLWWLKLVFPQSKYIHIHRDGRDVILSYLKAGIYENHFSVAHRWNNSIGFINFFTKRQKRDTVLATSYKNLVLETEKTVRSICSFLNISFNKKMITNYHNNFEKLGDTKKHQHHVNTSKKIFTSSLNKWTKADETEKQYLDEINPIIEKNLKLLGYLN